MVLILATVSVSVVADKRLPKSLAFMKRPLVGVVDRVRGGRRHSDGGRAHDTAPKPHPEDNLFLKESCGEMPLLPRVGRG